MIDRVVTGGMRYRLILLVGAAMVLGGVVAYAHQLTYGLSVTGLSRDVSWGLYIAQFTFLVGIAASAVMVVLPYYLHDYKAFGRMVILGEFLAVSAVLMCMLFVFVDMGQPARVLNVMLHPRPNSVMFWDMVVLAGYLVINLIIASVALDAERKEAPPPRWVRPLIVLSIPWAVSIHTVTAFLYAGLEARPFWMTAILAPRFLASAFASGPALLILLALGLRRYSRFDVGAPAIRALAVIVTYAMAVNVFFVGLELFTALYGGNPHHAEPFVYLFMGLEGHGALVPWVWTGQLLALGVAVLLLFPANRRSAGRLAVLCALVVVALWIEKGLALVVAGFVPNPLGHVTEYTPTLVEIGVTLGVYGVGVLVLAMLYRLVLSIRERFEMA